MVTDSSSWGILSLRYLPLNSTPILPIPPPLIPAYILHHFLLAPLREVAPLSLHPRSEHRELSNHEGRKVGRTPKRRKMIASIARFASTHRVGSLRPFSSRCLLQGREGRGGTRSVDAEHERRRESENEHREAYALHATSVSESEGVEVRRAKRYRGSGETRG